MGSHFITFLAQCAKVPWRLVSVLEGRADEPDAREQPWIAAFQGISMIVVTGDEVVVQSMRPS